MRHLIYVGSLYIKMVDTNKRRTYDQYLHQIPANFLHFIDDIIDVWRDGSYGYHAITCLISKYSETLRQDLFNEIILDKNAYSIYCIFEMILLNK